ncbi:hypothetical protein C3L33_23510, partial [Rhododendron williamsianum]
HLAYEYARRGAYLALSARREHRLRSVADRALELGAPDVIALRADVSRVDDCRRFVEEAHLAYEYARRGAYLALSARRENRLRSVADRALELGAPDVIAVRADVSRVDDCRRFVEEAVNHYGRRTLELR